MTKRKRRKAAKPKPSKIKKVVLPKTGAVRVVIPEGVAPTIVADPVKGVVEIVPVPVKKTWWQSVFG